MTLDRPTTALTALVAAFALCAATNALGPTTARAAAPTIDAGVPAAALPATAHRVVEAGLGARRVALWTATNPDGELCAGEVAGSSNAPPAHFTCLRRGLEQPLITAEHGGGRGRVATWGVIVGIAAPIVAKVETRTLYATRTATTLALRPIAGLPGWRSFTSGTLAHPTSTLVDAFDAAGAPLAESAGAAIHPRASSGITLVITVPGAPPSGPAWADSATNLPAFTSGVQSDLSLALADARVRTILALRGGWIDGASAWSNCSGRSLGHSLAFRFPAPVSFTATLPSVGLSSGPFSYAVTVTRVAATAWPDMTVWVDANSRTIAGIESVGTHLPGQADGQTVRLVTVTPTHDTGGADPAGPCVLLSG